MPNEEFEVPVIGDLEVAVSRKGTGIWSGVGSKGATWDMVLPTTVFLDTSALAGQQYNFNSTAMRAFMNVARERKLKLLIPDPMEREVQRQVVERIGDLLTSLDLARRKAPFLAGWSELTRLNHLSRPAAVNIGLFAWSQFLAKLEIEKLSCSTISTADAKARPKKDCYAEILRDQSARSGCVTAVVSEDPDFKAECDRYAELLYFSSVSALTELFLSDHASMARMKSSVARNLPLLEALAREKVLGMPFVHENRSYRVGKSEVHHVAVLDLRIVAIDPDECIVTFGVEVDATHEVARRSDGDDSGGELTEVSSASGTARIAFDRSVEIITSFELDDTALYISSELCRTPW